jgi:hypothetical protein
MPSPAILHDKVSGEGQRSWGQKRTRNKKNVKNRRLVQTCQPVLQNPAIRIQSKEFKENDWDITTYTGLPEYVNQNYETEDNEMIA